MTYLLDPEKRQQPSVYITELDAYTNHALHLADVIYVRATSR